MAIPNTTFGITQTRRAFASTQSTPTPCLAFATTYLESPKRKIKHDRSLHGRHDYACERLSYHCRRRYRMEGVEHRWRHCVRRGGWRKPASNPPR
ncbi:hypothetical protein DXT90_07895 [Agrobacterium tumefaciens]|nr:hypothetical protein [Agrobacterium tumefaciens]